MKLIIRKGIVILLIGLYQTAMGQGNGTDKSLENYPDRVFAADVFFQRAIPSGDNFIGNGLSNGTGYGLRLQFDVYDHIYVGGSLSQDFFKVKDNSEIGEFEKATKFNAYLFVGYDYQISKNFNLSADVGYGYSQNKNRQNSDQGSGKFRDTGQLLKFTGTVEYAFSASTSVILSPSYETVFYNIETAPALGSYFDTGNYFNIAIGIRMKVLDYQNVTLSHLDQQELQGLLNKDRDDLSIKEKRTLYFLQKKKAKRDFKKSKNK